MSDNAELPAKKLRFSEPDLQIVLGSDEDVSTIKVHSLLLANKSKYIDTMLSTPMREQETRTVSFPDISLAIWEKMNKFLDDPLAIRDMKIDDVLDVVLLYDKYEFTQGTKLCEKIMLDYLKRQSLMDLEQSYKLNLHLIIDLAVIAHQTNMKEVFEDGIDYLLKKLSGSMIMFTEEHLQKILPLLKHLPSNFSTNSGLSRLGRTLAALHGPERDDKSLTDMLNEPGVEKILVAHCREKAGNDLINRCISEIQLCGTGRRMVDGPFSRNIQGWRGNTVLFEGVSVRFWIKRATKDGEEVWAIVCNPFARLNDESQQEIYWWAPYSQNLYMPPLRGWVPCNELAKGNPTLKYILNETVE